MTKIAAEIPVLRERRDAAALEGNYDLVTSTNGEIDRMERWRDELFRNSEDPKKAERLQKKRERQLKRIKRMEEEPADGEKKKRRSKKD